MKKLLLAAVAVALAACGGENKKLPSSGTPYQLIVSVSDANWNAAGLGDTLRSVMGAPVPVINSYEPQFDVLHILPERFVDVARRNSDVIIVDIDKKYVKTGFVERHDEFAEPQLVVYALAPDAASLALYVHENGELLRGMFNKVEQERWTAAARKAPSMEMQRLVREQFGFTAALPNGMILGKQAPDFLWLRMRYPESDQELTFFSYEGTDLSRDALVAARDRFVALIPGETPESHMITATEFVEPQLRSVTIDGREWVEMRGLWEVKNDIMGGPFVSYSTVVDGRVVTVDGAVFSPSPYNLKRNMLRQLESVVYSIKI